MGANVCATGSNNLATGSENTVIGGSAVVSATGAANQTVIGANAIGQADNSVVLGDDNVTAVYMAEDSGATVYCSGVNFPDGTSHYSADANTLDDYEEGTVTVALADSSGAGAITIDSSYDQVLYTKIGNLVTVTGGLTVSAISSPSSELTVTGLPFTCKAQANGYDSIPAATVYFRDAASDIPNYVSGFVNQNTTTLVLREGGTTGSGGDLGAHVDTGTIIYIQLSYFTA